MNDNQSDTAETNPKETPDSAMDENSVMEMDPHADKYSDPRVKITRSGILMGIGVVILGIEGEIFGRWWSGLEVDEEGGFVSVFFLSS